MRVVREGSTRPICISCVYPNGIVGFGMLDQACSTPDYALEGIFRWLGLSNAHGHVVPAKLGQ